MPVPNPACEDSDQYGYANFGRRHIAVLMGFLFNLFMSGHQLSTAVALLSMVNQTNINDRTGNVSASSCPSLYGAANSTEIIVTHGEFQWNSVEQKYILSAYFFGFWFTQSAGGRMAETLGSKRTLMWSNLLAGLFTVVLPVVARWNYYAVVVLNFARGLGQGAVLPATHSMLGVWVPRNERSLLNAFVANGNCLGSAFLGIITGWICSVPRLGWASSFYITGALTILLSIVFQYTHAETPHVHSSISKEELVYITGGQEDNMSQKRPPVPWKKLLTSVPVHAAIISSLIVRWSLTYFSSVHPTYIESVLNYPIEKNGLASSLPFLLLMAGNTFASLISNFLYKRQVYGPTILRKGTVAFCLIGHCIGLVGLYLAACDVTLNWLFFSIISFSSGVAIAGIVITPIDLAPRFAGSVTGLLSFLTGNTATVLPVIVGAMTKENTLQEWHGVFFLCLSITVISSLVFIVFGSAEVQSWNFIEDQTAVNKKSTRKSTCL